MKKKKTHWALGMKHTAWLAGMVQGCVVHTNTETPPSSPAEAMAAGSVLRGNAA